MKILTTIGLIIISHIAFIGLAVFFWLIYYPIFTLLFPKYRRNACDYVPGFPHITIVGITFVLLFFELFLLCKWYSLIIFIAIDVIIIFKNSRYFNGIGKKILPRQIEKFIGINIFFVIVAVLAWMIYITVKIKPLFYCCLSIILFNAGLIWATAWTILGLYLREKYGSSGYYFTAQMIGAVGLVILFIMFIVSCF